MSKNGNEDLNKVSSSSSSGVGHLQLGLAS
jgi:hypothetical protein